MTINFCSAFAFWFLLKITKVAQMMIILFMDAIILFPDANFSVHDSFSAMCT